MAQARIIQRWPDSSETEVEVYADDSFPDALDQVCSEALRLQVATCTETDVPPVWGIDDTDKSAE